MITILLETTRIINGVAFQVESPFQLNLEENGKLFLRINKADKKKFIAACKG